ncbi:MAG: TonB-dependent receptor [Gemmatimonadota bacterium]|nr:TonB-dependent receptor [Gemmatimonadota bacterium]
MRALLLITCVATPTVAQQRPPSDSTRRDTSFTLPHVRVTAERAPRPDAASAVVISPEAIRTAPATNVWDLIRQTAGVEVHQQGQGPGFASDAVIRGFTSDHSADVALMIDGVPANHPVNGHAEGYSDWNEILPEAVSTIRVLKGPVSPWIGNFAMGGEIEVQSLPLVSGTRWSARAGSHGDAHISALGGGVGEHGGYLLGGDFQREDGWRPHSGSETAHLLGSRSWVTRGGTRFSANATAYGARWNSPGFLSLEDFTRGDFRRVSDPTDGGRSGVATVRGTVARDLGGGAAESMLYARGRDWHLFLNIPPEGGIGEGATSQTEERDRRADVGGFTRYMRGFGRLHLIVGADYRAVAAGYQRYFTTRRARDSVFAQLDATQLSIGPAIEAHLDLSPRLSLGVGGRLDALHYGSAPSDRGSRLTHTDVIATPKLSALAWLTDALSAYAAFNGGFRASDGVVANPTLAPAREWASEIGVRAGMPRLEGSVALFRVDVRNEQTFDPVTLSSLGSGRSLRQGVEADGRIAIAGGVALFTHATFNHARYTQRTTEEGESLAGMPVFGVSRETVEGGLDFQRGAVLGSLWVAHTGPFTPIGEPGARTEPYQLLDGRAVFPLLREWSLAIAVQNILDRSYQAVRASRFVSPGQPRTLMITLRRGG